ncbi:MAG: hypothetical protein JXX28_19080 [Deltaproteobacteria bacterium]|nr:hypothetical protein [Deltaproteobacteria bacterium]
MDPTAPNLSDVRMAVYCVPGPALSRWETNKLCQRVSTLFEHQGALVTTVEGPAADGEDDALTDDERPVMEAPIALRMELRSRDLYTNNASLSWAISLMTATVLPAVEESAFAVDVVIRDGSGFLLASESLQGRLITRYGVGTWAANRAADTYWRREDQRLFGDISSHDLSEDLYRQLSQLAYNARVQRQVLEARAPAEARP